MDITQNNIQAVRNQIQHKLNYNRPYYASLNNTQVVLNDMDNFPYNRFFRGVYHESNPIIFEREAGWRRRKDNCYRDIVVSQPCPTNYCWQYPCSTVFPCNGNSKMRKQVGTGNPITEQPLEQNATDYPVQP